MSSSTPTFVPVVPLSEIPENGTRAVTAFGHSIVLCRSGGLVYALANECSHQRQPLLGGKVRGHLLFCPVHGACYDMRTGKPQGPLTQQPVRTYGVRIAVDWVEVSDSMP
jgi:3-phenylpropionate/trans-cinnamate dioxygenase ferredoxin subunit